MHRYRWLLAAAFAASAAIFGAAYHPSATPAPPRAAPVFDMAQRHVAATVKGLRSAVALPRLGVVDFKLVTSRNVYRPFINPR